MSNISILDIAALNNDSLLAELSETELQVAGGGNKRGGCYGRGGKGSGKGRGGKGSGSGKGRGGKGSSSRKGRGGRGGCHACW
jgi:hypothetical protein